MISQGNHNVLVYPIILNGKTEGVVMLARPGLTKGTFSEADEDLVKSYMLWAEIALQYSGVCKQYARQTDLRLFLLNVVK